MPNNGMWLNTLLDEEHTAEFEMVKAFHGLRTNTEVVRFLIHQEARRIQQQVNGLPAGQPLPSAS